MRLAGLLALILCLVPTARADPRAERIMYLLELERTKLHIAGIAVAVVRELFR